MSKRFFVDQIPPAGSTVEITDTNELRHITKALRLSVGDSIKIADGKGTSALAEISNLEKRSITLIVKTVEKAENSATPPISLWQGLMKSPRMDWLVEKAAELGIDRICPVICEFSVHGADKTDRWVRIAKSALKQSGASKLLEIIEPRSFSKLPEFKSSDLLFVLSLEDGSVPGLAHAIDGKKPGASNHIHLFVGPEGGFSVNELAELKRRGATACSLGPTVLRGETAALIACGITRHSIDFSRSKKI